jgi:hypothetical protein
VVAVGIPVHPLDQVVALVVAVQQGETVQPELLLVELERLVKAATEPSVTMMIALVTLMAAVGAGHMHPVIQVVAQTHMAVEV